MESDLYSGVKLPPVPGNVNERIARDAVHAEMSGVVSDRRMERAMGIENIAREPKLI
jgi:hypothetical protein